MIQKTVLEDNLIELEKHSAQRDALEKLIKLQGAGFREKPIGINHLRVLDEIAISGECTKQYLHVRLGIDENTIRAQLHRLSTKGEKRTRID